MHLHSSLLTLLPLSALSIALPQSSTHDPLNHPLSSRDDGEIQDVDRHTYHDAATNITFYAPSWPTCANDPSITTPFGAQPLSAPKISDCDAAIEAICLTADKMTPIYPVGGPPPGKIPLKSLTETKGDCVAHMAVGRFTTQEALGHDECVKRFQKITIDCMLVGQGRWAEKGRQAGLMNMMFDPAAAAKGEECKLGVEARLRHAERWNLEPGFMVGPKGYFEGFCGVEPEGLEPEALVEGEE